MIAESNNYFEQQIDHPSEQVRGTNPAINMNTFQSNTCKTNLDWPHFNNQTGV